MMLLALGIVNLNLGFLALPDVNSVVELVKTSALVSRRLWVRISPKTPINFFILGARESTEHTVLSKYTSGRGRNSKFKYLSRENLISFSYVTKILQ